MPLPPQTSEEKSTETVPAVGGPASVSEVIESSVSPQPGSKEAAQTTEEPPLPIYGFQWQRDGKLLLRYLLDSEVHTFAFSVAANAILSFIPFIVLLYTIAHSVFHSQPMADVIGEFIKYLFPSNQDWIAAHLAAVAPQRGASVISLLLILISCTGIFLPLEVALNRSWGVAKSRNYIMNQLIALGLALWMVTLGMLSITLNAGERTVIKVLLLGHADNWAARLLSESWLAISTSIAGILLFFSIYWILPNRKLPARPVLRVSIVTGILWIAAKYGFVAVLPHLNLRTYYGPFYVSVGLLLWGYVSGLLLFAGAKFSAMRHGLQTASRTSGK
ncbi:YihY/virulence factor BrkB family protein [Acidicapsa dinghuensis]|uniref:YihY/virulence factor BrkB family protein n=1 Tax=Acidicapsa dinghuensis TaxID=2218256 RepID=A0ABW1EMT7_9BACT|nr:YihY/virulence factor BrkB family protein [Acidicapsa dinghuensis]